MRLTRREGLLLGEQLSHLLQHRLPLPTGLRALAEETDSRRARRVLARIAGEVESGRDVAAALTAVGDRLTPELRGAVEAGIAVDRLPGLLAEYVRTTRRALRLRRLLWARTLYPLLLLAVLAGILVVAFGWLVPLYRDLADDFGMNLPAVTRLVMGVADTVGGDERSERVGRVLDTAALGAAAAVLLMVFTPFGRRWVKYLPVFGHLHYCVLAVRLLRLVRLFLDAGTPLPHALRLVADKQREPDFRVAALTAAEHLSAGHTLADSLEATALGRAGMWPLLDWGERNGRLDRTLAFLADAYERRLDQRSELLGRVLPLLFYYLFAVLLGLLIAATVVPIWQLLFNFF